MRDNILLHGFKRLARQESRNKRQSTWKMLAKRYAFSDDQKYQAERALALAWIHQGHPDIMAKLKGFSVRPEDHKMHEIRIREALANKRVATGPGLD